PQPTPEDRRKCFVLCSAAGLDCAKQTFLAIRASYFWEDLPKHVTDQTVRRHFPHFARALIYMDNLPLSIDRTESVSDCFEYVLSYADKSDLLYFVDVFIAGERFH